MPVPPSMQGGLRPSKLLTWVRDDPDETPEDLSGATITAVLMHRDTQEARDATGVFTVTDALAGQFRWDHSAADVAVPGAYFVYFTAVFLAEPSPAISMKQDWVVHPVPQTT